MTNNEALLVGIISGLLTQFGADMGWKAGVAIDADHNYVQPITVTTKASTYEITVKEVKDD